MWQFTIQNSQSTILLWLPRISGALALVALAAGISRWQRLGLERNMLVAVTRAFVQLVAIGYALDLIFASDSLLAIGIIISVMVSIAGWTAGKRAHNIPHSVQIALISIAISTILTVGLLILLAVFEVKPRFIIPISGMVIGNSMTATALTMGRLRDDIRILRPRIETALSLGATSRQAVSEQLRVALMTGMTPIIDSTKTVGLISLPGAMTGMILAGASPLEAVQLQIVVMYMLIGAAAFSSLTATFLTYRQFFTPAHQLKL